MVDIYWYGQSCFKIKGKTASIVVDPYSSEFTGLKSSKIDANIVCVSHNHEDHNNSGAIVGNGDMPPFEIAGPGEYEITGVNIVGVSSYHDDKKGEERGKNTIYQIVVDGVNIVHLGDLGQKELTQNQVEMLSGADVLMIPVGGTFTIDAKEAPSIIAQLDPKIIVPMHYRLDGLKFDLLPVDDFLKAMGKENLEKLPKLSVSEDKLPEEPQVVLLEKSN